MKKTHLNLGMLALVLMMVVLATEHVYARIEINILGGVEGQIPILIEGIPGEQNIARNYSGIIASDLHSSGLFALSREQSDRKTDASIPPLGYSELLQKGYEQALTGQRKGKGKMLFVLHDVVKKKVSARWLVLTEGSEISDVSHHVSNLVFEKIIGFPGNFTSKLAFVHSVMKGPNAYEFGLYISDFDGHNAKLINRSNDVIMSPAWSPDFRHIAYVRFQMGIPHIYIQKLRTRDRCKLLPGTSATWSPGGNKLAYVSDKGGNADVYVYDFKSRSSRRVTKNLSVDTEPSWLSEHGLFFTSDRKGSPQIYYADLEEGSVAQFTTEGNYNTDSSVSPNGDAITYIGRKESGNFSVFVQNLEDNSIMDISSGLLDERPRFAPNGQQLGFLTKRQGERLVVLISLSGEHEEYINIPFDRVREIAWSPLQQDHLAASEISACPAR